MIGTGTRKAKLTAAAAPWHRRDMGSLPRFVLVSALALACGCSSNPKAEEPPPSGDGPTTSEPPEGEPSTSTEPAEDPVKPPPSGVKTTGVDGATDNSVPDDYTLMAGDCAQLGKKLGDLWRAELRASLSPKLTEKQREKAEESIDDGATKKEDDWANGCIKSLVGKSVDPKALKCAFDSKDLKAFEKCLN